MCLYEMAAKFTKETTSTTTVRNLYLTFVTFPPPPLVFLISHYILGLT
jgi:hypothetical protein